MNIAPPPPGADCALNLLVFGDAITATQAISFLQPMVGSITRGVARLQMVGHDKIKDIDGALNGLDERPTALILSRYTWSKGKLLAHAARERGVPVIYHIDDDLLNVPMSLGPEKYAAYNSPERIGALRANMEAADLLYASTPALAHAFESYGLAVPIVPGDLYCSVDPDAIGEPALSTMPTIGYMGTGGHSADLALALPAIEALMDELPFLRFETFGTIARPQSLARFGNRYAHHGAVPNYVGFVDKLRSLGWWIGLAPLEDNPFNRCKADTKWVECSLAGMATVASDLPVYHRACADGAGVLCTSNSDWFEAMRSLVLDGDLRRGIVAAAQRKLRDVYSHAALERQLRQVVGQAWSLQGRHAVATAQQ